MFKTGRRPSHCFRAFTLVAALIMPHDAARAAFTPNLLVNGGAETGRCTDDWTAQTSVPAWHVERGAASVLCYSAFEYAGTVLRTPRPAAQGNALFAAPGADTSLVQPVDVSAARIAIDRGEVGFDLSGWLGGWRDRPERATLTATFLDAVGRATGAPVILADADAAARGDATALLMREAKGRVPPGTRRIDVTLQFLSGMESFQNAYADNVALRLTGRHSAILHATPAPAADPPSVPALDHVFVVMMENTNAADVVRDEGSAVSIDPAMPYLGSLARRGVVLANTWQTYHPSDQNYVAMIAGDTFRHGPVYYPHYDLKARHLGDLLNAQGKNWRAYVQYMGPPCNSDSTGNGRRSFSPDDEPFVQFHDVIEDPRRCAAHVRDLADLSRAIDDDALPEFAWIAADNWWDGEGAWERRRDVEFSNARQDEFLRDTLAPLLQSPAWRQSRSLLVVTWDEADGWGWPDNHVPTFLVASPGLLREGTVVRRHVDGYDLLKMAEGALGVGGLRRFDDFARPPAAAFLGGETDASATLLWPAPSIATRGSSADTFGRATTPAAVVAGRPIALFVPAGVDESTSVALEPLGTGPDSSSTSYEFDSDRIHVSIPTDGLAPGAYGAWLRHAGRPPARAALMVGVLPPPLVAPTDPGVEIIGAELSPTFGTGLREGSNPFVRYCLEAGASAADSWIGVFPADTPVDQMTRRYADHVGYWLKTPGGPSPACGEAEAYASELTPRQSYRILLLRDGADGSSRPVGRGAAFYVIPSLPAGK